MPFVIDIDPVAFRLGFLDVRWYGIAAVVAIIVAYHVARVGTRRAGIADAVLADGAMWVGLAALAGGRGLFLIQNDLDAVLAHPAHALAVWHGGLSFLGGLIVAVPVLALFARRRGVAFGITADAIAPAAAIGQAIGHVGCLIGGDSFGLPTDLPWGVVYRDAGAMAPRDVPLHPTQLYEALALVLLFAGLWYGRGRLGRIGAGAVAASYLIGISAIRFGLFFLRDEVDVVFGLKTAQLLSIGLAIVGVVWLLRVARSSHGLPTARSSAPPPVEALAAPATGTGPSRT